MSDSASPPLPPEIVFDNQNQELVARIQAAMLHPLAKTFSDSIDTLVRLATNVKGSTKLFLDFAPLSFGFCVVRGNGSAWINGGVLFHGAHDGYGSGSAPTFAVSVGGADGWQIHT